MGLTLNGPLRGSRFKELEYCMGDSLGPKSSDRYAEVVGL